MNVNTAAPTLATAPGTAEGLTGFETTAAHPSETGNYTRTHEQDAHSNRVQIPMEGERNDRDFNPDHEPTRQYSPPSKIMDGRQVPIADEVPQQGSTQPGDGTEVRRTDDGSHGRLHGPSTHEVPFKERVVGVAQVTRGTLLRKPDLKEHGEAILEGRTTHAEDKQKN
ncbi:hypothetical protein NMY22_g19301 [Coprinellus aureogranulatus]|nr:hypothetical protein NMY22_g19301 [Coprinellus aureogranulatus]